MSEGQVEAIGGWLKEQDSSLDRSYRRLSDISTASFSADHIAYFEDYRRRYFNECLIPGQGVDEILQTLKQQGGTPRSWIDLGAGVTTLFWATGVNSPQAVAACDLVPEALHVLSLFKDRSELPQCYKDGLEISGKTESDFNAIRSLKWDFHVMDCLKPWTLPGESSGFDLITAIGCFGLAADAERYEEAFSAAAAWLEPGGRLVGADWIRSAAFIEKEEHDNRYLGCELATRCAQRTGLATLSCQTASIAGDPYYDALIVWAFSRDG